MRRNFTFWLSPIYQFYFFIVRTPCPAQSHDDILLSFLLEAIGIWFYNLVYDLFQINRIGLGLMF